MDQTNKSRKLNVVIITGEYGCIMSPESNCMDKYLKRLKCNCSLQVISPRVKEQQFDSAYDGIKVKYISSFWHNLRVVCQSHITENSNAFFFKVLLTIVRLHGFIIAPFVFPTRNKWRIGKYIQAINEVERKSHIDVIMSVAGLPCAHMGALHFKKKHPEVKWITYTLDPFSLSPDIYRAVFFKNRRRKKNYRLEKQIFDTADFNIFTQELFDIYKEYFCLSLENSKVFPYVLSPFTINIIKRSRNNDYMVAVYAGALNRRVRNPRRMLEVMAGVKDLIIDLYVSGDCDNIIDEYKKSHIYKHSLLPLNEYVQLINTKADVLINIGNSTNLMSPSKFMELLSTGLPIINFYENKDSSYSMINNYPLGLNVGPFEERGSEIVTHFCERVRGQRLSFEDVCKLYPDNIIENQMKVLLEIMMN